MTECERDFKNRVRMCTKMCKFLYISAWFCKRNVKQNWLENVWVCREYKKQNKKLKKLWECTENCVSFLYISARFCKRIVERGKVVWETKKI